MENYISNRLSEEHKIVKISLKDLYLPPISRSIWSQLPSDVRHLLEKEHSYNHYNPELDVIESDKFLCLRKD